MPLFRLSLKSFPLIVFSLVYQPLIAQAQILPDQTLGAESSRITPEQLVRGSVADLIEGGAARGGNLFHSFSEFNVTDGQRVYFANQAGIDSILSRVTGSNPSNILGTLGVDGSADLFLINPNGIVFGENALLDVQGSFYGTTAEAIKVGDGLFSAVVPQQSQLLRVNPSALFWNYLTENSGNVVNRGQLAVGSNLVLAGNSLDLQGQVAAAGDVSLLAVDKVLIQDRAEVPFVGFAGGELLVQGNQQLDIVALSHPDSGLYSYGDMVLRSANQVGGDTHYWSAGDFRIEDLDNEAGDLYSPIDPIVRSLGDVVIDQYIGTSLHILAGGSITLGSATITAPEQGVGNLDFLQDVVTLSDGTVLEIDGNARPTLDIRAGVEPNAIGTPPLDILTGFDFNQDIFIGNASVLTEASSADITVGDVVINDPNGLVFFTNQYKPNTSLTSGNIFLVGNSGINSITTSTPELTPDLLGSGVSFFADSRDNIGIISLIDSSSRIGNSGNITILADDNIILSGGQRLAADARGEGNSGNILIDANGTVIISGEDTLITSDIGENAVGEGGSIVIRGSELLMEEFALIRASTLGRGNSGKIVIEINGPVEINGPENGIVSTVGSEAIGDSGGIEIKAESLLLNTAFLQSTSLGQGNPGDIDIDVIGSVELSNFGIVNVLFFGLFSGNGGDINIQANSLSLRNNSEIGSSALERVNAGNIQIDVDESVTLENRSSIESIVRNSSTASSGEITILAKTLFLDAESKILTAIDSDSAGSSGNILLDVNDSISLGNTSFIGSVLGPRAVGNSGEISIQTSSLLLNPNSQITTVLGESATGSVGQILIQADDSVRLSGQVTNDPSGGLPLFTRISSVNLGNGDGGDVSVFTNNLELLGDAQITNSVFGQGDSGDVYIETDSIFMVGFPIQSLNQIPFTAIGSRVEEGGRGNSGSLFINTGSLVMSDAQISSSVIGKGRAGDININSRESISLFNNSDIFSNVASGGEGEGGDIFLHSESLLLRSGSSILAIIRRSENSLPAGQGVAGNIFLDVEGEVSVSGVNAFTNLESNISTSIDRGAQGEGGTVQINASKVEITDRAIISSTLDIGAIGSAGNIKIDTEELSISNGGRISTTTFAQGDAGTIFINAEDSVSIQGNPDVLATGIATRAESQAIGNGGTIEIHTKFLALSENAILSSRSQGLGNSGNILITSLDSLRIQDSVVETSSLGSSGGDLHITARNIRLLGDGDIETFVDEGNQGGGNIIISADSVLAFDDSDILAFAADGSGGNITLNTPAFFGENYIPDAPSPFDNNERVDINASGAVDGVITLPDVSFIQNSLIEISENFINTENLIASSCIVRSKRPNQENGRFIITGTGSLPERPGDASISHFPMGTVRNIPNNYTSSNPSSTRSWKIGDPIIEPQGVYRLPNGELVLSRECP